MAHYRKIDTRIWNDAKFNALSNDAKFVFLFILTHPNLTALGAMKATIPGMACEISMKEEAFREAFQEVLRKALIKHDERHGLVFVPNFIKYNAPGSPNVLKAFAKPLEYLPECSLKREVIDIIRNFVDENMSKAFKKDLPKAFREAFQEGLPKGFQEGIPEGIPKPINNKHKTISIKHKTISNKKNNNTVVVDEFLASPVDNVVMTIPLVDGELFVEEFMIDSWIETYPNVDVMQQLKEIRQWFKDKPDELRTGKTIKGFINIWLSNRQNRPYTSISGGSPASKVVKKPKCVVEGCKEVVIGDYCGHNFCINPEHKKIAWNK